MQQAPAEHVRWTSADLALLPDDGARYEVIRTQAALHRTHTLLPGDTLQTPVLPGFSCPVARLFPE